MEQDSQGAMKQGAQGFAVHRTKDFTQSRRPYSSTSLEARWQLASNFPRQN